MAASIVVVLKQRFVFEADRRDSLFSKYLFTLELDSLLVTIWELCLVDSHAVTCTHITHHFFFEINAVTLLLKIGI